MKQKIRLDTMTDIKKFVEVANRLPYKITLQDNDGHCVSARSIIGALYSMEWSDIYCVSEADLSAYFIPWTI